MFNASLFGETRTELVDRLDAADTFTRWVQLVPELAADGTVSSVAEVLAALEPGTDRTRWDGLLLALLRLAAADGADQADAVFVVLQAVADGAARLLRRSTTPSRRGARPDFTEGLVLGQLTIQIRTYTRGAPAPARSPPTCCSTPSTHCAARCTRRGSRLAGVPSRSSSARWTCAARSTPCRSSSR
jgi:hypothetical protein